MKQEFTKLCLFLLSFVAVIRAQPGDFNPLDDETCVSLDDIIGPGLPDACLHTQLIPCEEAIIANFTVGDFVNQGAVVTDDEPVCQILELPALGQTGCEACLKYRTFEVTPSSARLLPYLSVEQADSGPPCLVPTGDFDVFQQEIVLGNDCTAPNCGACMEKPGCGWCEMTRACIADKTVDGEMSSDPFCDGECGDESTWVLAGTDVLQCPETTPAITNIVFPDYCKIQFETSTTDYTCDMPHNINTMEIDTTIFGDGHVIILLNDEAVTDVNSIAVPHDMDKSQIEISVFDGNGGVVPPKYNLAVTRVDPVPMPPTNTPPPPSIGQKVTITYMDVENCPIQFQQDVSTYECTVRGDADHVKLHVFTEPENAVHMSISVIVDNSPKPDWEEQIDVKMNATTFVNVLLLETIGEREEVVEDYTIQVIAGEQPAQDGSGGSSVPSTEVIIGMTIGSIGLVALFAAFLLCKRTSKIYEQVRKHSMKMHQTSINQRRVSAGGGSSGLAMTPQRNPPPRKYRRLDEDHEDEEEPITRVQPPPPNQPRPSNQQKRVKSPDGQTSLLSDQDTGVGLGVVPVVTQPKKKPSSFSRLAIDDDDSEEEEPPVVQEGVVSDNSEVKYEPPAQPSGDDHIQAAPEPVVKKAPAVLEGVADVGGKNEPLLAQEND